MSLEPKDSSTGNSIIIHDDVADDDDNNEMRRSFKDFIEIEELKFRFSDAPFHRYWKFMKKIGWTHNASKRCYQAPPLPLLSTRDTDGKEEKEKEQEEGKTFESSNAIFSFLDQYAIPEVFSNLQSPSSSLSSSGGGASNNDNNTLEYFLAEQSLGRRLRRDILTEVYRSRLPSSSSLTVKENDHQETPLTRTESQEANSTNGDADEADEEADDEPPSYTRRSTRSTNAAEVTAKSRSLEAAASTVTALEKGTDLYLHRNTRNKASRNKKTSFHIDDADNDDDSNNNNKPLYQPTLEECAKLVENYPIDYDNGVEALEAAYEAEFEQWRFLLSTNHSLLLHGAGSKRRLLQNFARIELLKEGYALMIDGFDADVSITGILNLLVNLFLNKQEPSGLSAIPRDQNGPDDVPVIGRSNLWRAHPIVERAIAIGRALALAVTQVAVPQDDAKPIFLVIHNLEGERLRNTLAQDALAALAVNSTVANGVAVVRIVASVDHVNAPTLLWNSNVATAANFAWMHLEVHTHRPYTVELTTIMLIETTTDVQRRSRETMRKNKELVQNARVLDVLRNLAPRHAEVVQILARLQLNKQQETKKNGAGGGSGGAAAAAVTTGGWVSFRDFSKSCQTACAVNKETQLHLFVDELRDHGLVVSKDSSEYVRIPYQEAKLREILAFKIKSSC
jgi:origin recognition complex subunit 2